MTDRLQNSVMLGRNQRGDGSSGNKQIFKFNLNQEYHCGILRHSRQRSLG